MPSKRTSSKVTAAKRPRGRPRGSKSKVKPAVTWRDSLILYPGETVRQVQRITRGNLDQDEVEHHEVIDARGQIVGTITYAASTSLKPPFVTRHWLVQKYIAGKVLVDVRW